MRPPILAADRRTFLPPLAGLATLAILIGLAAAAAPRSAAQTPPPASLTCAWAKLNPLASQGLYHAATAYDSLGQAFYLYGGIDQSGDTVNFLGRLDLSDPDPAKAVFQPVAPNGSRSERYGAAAAFRPKGDDSAIYFIGGADSTGDASTEVQIYHIKSNTWRRQVPTGGQKRVFHTAAYDPEHDVIVVHGGTKQCKVLDQGPDDTCTADSLRTQFLKVDDVTGELSWINGPQGGPTVIGQTMVHDAKRKRMYAYGGSRDAKSAEDRIWVLNLADPDLDRAAWGGLNVAGTEPQGRFLHGAAYDAAHDMMVIYGGVTQTAFTRTENAVDDTWALELAGSSPVWRQHPTSLLDRVGAGMEYSPRHGNVVLFGGRAQFREGRNQSTSREFAALPCGIAPTPTATQAPTNPTPGGPLTPRICDTLRSRVPQAVIANAVANAAQVQGFGQPCNVNIPPDPISNPPRRHLSLLNPSVPWNPLFNDLVYQCGCD